MSAHKKHIFKISHMKIEGNVLSWDDHALRISGISHIWAGPRTEHPFPYQSALILLFIALASRRIVDTVVMLVILVFYLGAWALCSRSGRNTKLVNIGFSTGAVYSFAPPNDSFAQQLCGTLTGLMEGNNTVDYEISFLGDGTITALTPPEPAPQPKAATVLEASMPAGKNGQLISELQQLYQCYTKKNNTGSEILDLINDTSRLIEINDAAGIKASFTKFVTLGLISDCNELGLDSLIKEIKAILY